MKQNRICSLLLAVVMAFCAVPAGTALAAEQALSADSVISADAEGEWRGTVHGSSATGLWQLEGYAPGGGTRINTYFFDETGAMQTGFFHASELGLEGDDWYFFYEQAEGSTGNPMTTTHGQMVKGYYVENPSNGYRTAAEAEQGKVFRYYFDEQGRMFTGWYNSDMAFDQTGTWRYFGEIGWSPETSRLGRGYRYGMIRPDFCLGNGGEHHSYFFSKTGGMMTGEKVINGETLVFRAEGEDPERDLLGALLSEPAPEPEPWINSDILGSVTADMEISLKDDFHAANNQAWLSAAAIPEGQNQAGAFVERELEVTAQIKALLTDGSRAGHEAELARTLYDQYTDMETRNALGMDPAIEHMERIAAISSIEELTAYLTDAENNIAGTLMGLYVSSDTYDSTQNRVYISSPGLSLEDADEYKSMTATGQLKQSAYEAKYAELLALAGVDEETAAAMIADFQALESAIGETAYGLMDMYAPDYHTRTYNPVTIDELAELSPNYPAAELLMPYAEAGVDTFILQEPEWLERMNELYAEENLEMFKSFLSVNLLENLDELLNQEALDAVDRFDSTVNGVEIRTNVLDEGVKFVSKNLDMAVAKMYTDAYYTEDMKAEVTGAIDQVIAAYRQRLENNDWLGEETRAMAIEKLDNMTVRAMYPDDWSVYDYSSLELTPTAEGGSLIENMMAIWCYDYHVELSRSAGEVDRRLWIMSPQTVNAGYNPADNSINIPAGILGGVFYDPEGSIEQLYGGIAVVIGHEISHGFDKNGSIYDKDGNMANWWTDEDRAAYDERTAKVAEYFGSFEVLSGVFLNGELVVGEAVADLGGVSVALELAKDIEGFDYELFFHSYSSMWRKQMGSELAENKARTDPHPPGFIRTNAVVQQFAEFYDVFGIGEDDGMYLAPEARLSVW